MSDKTVSVNGFCTTVNGNTCHTYGVSVITDVVIINGNLESAVSLSK